MNELMCRVSDVTVLTWGTGTGRLAPPPAPPARSPTTELSSRIPPPLPLSSLRNGHLHSLGKTEQHSTFNGFKKQV